MQGMKLDDLPDSVKAMNPHLFAASAPAVPLTGKPYACEGLERDLLRLCCHDLTRAGVQYLHLSPQAREKRGWPDLVFVLNGIPWAVELKTATGVVSEDQQRIMEAMAVNGWHVAVVRSHEQWRKEVFL